MDNVTAEIIGRKARALKHCDKLLATIDKNGSAKVKLNCTGVEFVVHKDDAIYLSIQKTKYALLCDIRSYEITVRAKDAETTPIRRTAPAPVGAAETTPADEELERKRAKRREYNRRYREKVLALKAAAAENPTA